MIEFKMPSLGADMEAGTLVEWFKQPGDRVQRGDVIALVETQKGAIEIEVFNEGVIGEQLVQPGSRVPVGTALANILSADEVQMPLPGTKPTEKVEQRPIGRVGPVRPATTPRAPSARITPAARQRAAALGISLESLSPGSDGVIGLAQVPRSIECELAPERKPSGDRPGLDRDEMRKAISAAMARSHRDIPHYWVAQSVDVTPLFDWLTTQNAIRPIEKRLLYVAPLMKAVALALKEVPELNGRYEDGVFRSSPVVHMGLATSLRGGGLIAPAIRDADSKSVNELMGAIADLVPRARLGRLHSSEMTDGTITLSNLGEGNAEFVFPLIYPPQVAIVGCGTASSRPWAVGDAVVVRRVLQMTLAGDHRVSHGRHAAQFLTRFSELVSHPEAL
ncbi:dihydrolipoamide acetyltransferase family protein [Rhizobium sp. IBUN]|uniref:dihydrolipoamide acetyltransferase family protein n=1 Tax=Rhizobium sp. IBUN TaxID=1042326 RepID=UPI0004180B77|nr:dihydrolipoamide acetyltransferase family protein [Rhizobium sp. IBUN]